jgi:hypothetical protein
MRVWESERYAWERLDALGGAAHVPAALDALSGASTSGEADAAYWQIDNFVVVQGVPREAAVATAACVVVLLPICSRVSRPRLIELLETIGSGDPGTPVELDAAIFREVVKAYGFYAFLLQYGEEAERSCCIDLVLYCAEHDENLRASAQFYLERIIHDAGSPEQLRSYAAARLEFERSHWS